jgi:DNA-binding NtrC family response regulator
MKSVKPGNLLVVDDDKDVLYTSRLVLRNLFARVDTLDRPLLIPEFLNSRKYDVILLDMNFSRGDTSGKEGLEWLERILKIDPDACVLTTTAYGEINLAVQAIKKGAADFIIKPWNREQLISAVTKAARHCNADSQKRIKDGVQGNNNTNKHPEIISNSPVMARISEIIQTVAPTDANILILGENGTGKELVARALHNHSLRNQKPFIHVDLGSIPESLFEAELFGHTRGAFTDAKEDRAGRFETASGGTLFLDEIGNLTPPLQAKILSAIQSREIVRIGSNRPVPVNIRLISATNKPLYEMAESFEFRQDLLYRINTVEIILPPLRDRVEDIKPIAEYYINIFSRQYGRNGIKIKDETLRKLKDYHWPGNIRELAHTIERAIIFCKNDFLAPDDFVLRSKPSNSPSVNEEVVKVEDFEKLAINKAMAKHNGNLSKAAEEVGIARSTLYRKIARFGMNS